MKFEIGFDYPVSYVRNKCRTSEQAVFRGHAEIEIEELPEDAGRLVFAAGTSDSVRGISLRSEREDCAFLIDGRAPRFLEIDGRLYRERCTTDDLAALTNSGNVMSPFSVAPRESSELKSLVSQAGYASDKVEIHDRDSLTRKIVKEHHSGWRGKPVPPEGVFRTFKDDAGAAAKALILDRAHELKVVAGSVYAPASEPVLFVAHVGSTSEAFTYYIGVCEARDNGWSRFGTGAYHPLHNGTVESFPIDGIDQARAALERSRGEEATYVDLSKIEFVDHAAIRFDPSVTFRAAATQLGSILPDNAARLTPELIGPLVTLRDVLRGSPSWTTPELVDAIRNVLSADPEGALNGMSFDSEEWNDTAQRDHGFHDHARLWANQRIKDAREALAQVDGSTMLGLLAGTAPIACSEAGTLTAGEIVSDYDAALVVDSLRATASLPPRSTGDALIVVESASPCGFGSRAERHAAVLFGADGEIAAALGKAGSPPSPSSLGLAKAHYASLAQARIDHGVDAAISDEDRVMLSFD